MPSKNRQQYQNPDTKKATLESPFCLTKFFANHYIT